MSQIEGHTDVKPPDTGEAAASQEDKGDNSGLLGAAIGAASSFLSQLGAIDGALLLERDALLLEKDDWLREKNSLYTQIMSLNKRLSDCQEQDCGSDSILDAEDLADVLTGDATPPPINPDGRPS